MTTINRIAILAFTSIGLLSCAADAPEQADTPQAPVVHVPLTPELETALALEPFVTDTFLADNRQMRCVVGDDATRGDLRRTVRGTLPDGSGVVVMARAAGDARLQRVEVIRRPNDSPQVGVTWDASNDSTLVAYWAGANVPASSRTPGQGGAIAARLRDLGIRTLGVRCPMPEE